MSREAFIYVVFPSLCSFRHFLFPLLLLKLSNFSFFAKTFFFISNKNKTHLH